MKQLFRKCSRFYGNLKLQSKFTLALILAVSVPFLLVFTSFYGKLYGMIVSYTISQEQDTSAETAPKIEETVQTVIDISNDLTSLPFYRTVFYSPLSGSLSGLSSCEEAEEFCSTVRQLSDGKPVTAIRIYLDLPSDNETEAFYSSGYTQNIFAPVSQVLGTYWHGIFQGGSMSELFCPSFYLGTQEKTMYGDMAYIRETTVYYREESHNAYIVVYYSGDSISSILGDNLSLEGSVSYIINERNNLVSSSNTSLSGIYWLNYETIRESFMSSNNFIERTILDEKIYACFYSIPSPGWFMVTVLPSGPLIRQSKQLMLQFILIYLAVLLLAFGLASLLARSITTRISSVISQMQAVREGPPVPMAEPDTHDEVGDLIETYNYMTGNMKQLMEDQAKAAEDLRIAEFNSLQAQINPHFLYNTMDMINWLACQGRTSEITSAVQDLSRFYKLTLSRKNSISTIASEEEHITIYVRLQNMRFHHSIELISDIPDELLMYQIPKLTLQPVIENAILHGILEKDSKSGTIVLTGWMEAQDIFLLISDDGVGIAPEILETILSGSGTGSSGGTNIAICNTHRRLQILYGPEYGLSYNSAPGSGTEVQIRIPALRTED